jgi:hypothetical protein
MLGSDEALARIVAFGSTTPRHALASGLGASVGLGALL